MAKLIDMSDKKKTDPKPQTPKEASSDDGTEMEADDTTMGGSTLMEQFTIPFFVGGENFIKELEDDAGLTLENKTMTSDEGDEEGDSAKSTEDEEVAGSAESSDDDADEDDNDDTVTSFSHYDSLFPDES